MERPAGDRPLIALRLVGLVCVFERVVGGGRLVEVIYQPESRVGRHLAPREDRKVRNAVVQARLVHARSEIGDGLDLRVVDGGRRHVWYELNLRRVDVPRRVTDRALERLEYPRRAVSVLCLEGGVEATPRTIEHDRAAVAVF